MRKIAEAGFRYSLAIAFNRLVPPWLFRLRRFEIHEISGPRSTNLPPAAESAIPPLPRCEIHEANYESEIRQAEMLTGFHRSGANPSQNLAVVAACRGEQMVGAVWQATNSFHEPELGLRMVVGSGDRWLFSAYVHRDCRRQAVYRQLIEHLAASGEASRLLFAINPDNRRSAAAHRALGSRVTGHATVARLFRWAWLPSVSGVRAPRRYTWNCRLRPLEIDLSGS